MFWVFFKTLWIGDNYVCEFCVFSTCKCITDHAISATHLEPSELTEPSLDSLEPCLTSLFLGRSGMTSQLRCTPLLSGLLAPPPRKTAGKGEMTGLVIDNSNEHRNTNEEIESRTHWDKWPIFQVQFSHWGKNPHFIQKFTFWKSQFLQNSQFQNLNFHKIHISEISFFTKFTILKSHFS